MYSGFAATLKASHRRKKMAKRKTDDSLTLTQQQTISTTITYYDLQDWGITSASGLAAILQASNIINFKVWSKQTNQLDISTQRFCPNFCISGLAAVTSQL